MKLIITGANGYLGRSLYDYFSLTNEVFQFSRTNSTNHYTYSSIESKMSKADTVIHCAGITKWFGSKEEFYKINEEWTASLAQQACENHIKLFIYISSVAVYGYWNRRDSITESDITFNSLQKARITDYGQSKLAAEYRLRSISCIRSVIFRCGLIYDDQRLQRQIENGYPLYRPTSRLPYVHINNVCLAIRHSLNNQLVKGIYNLVDDEQPYVSQLASSNLKKSKRKVYIRCAKSLVKGLISRRHHSVRTTINSIDLAFRSNTYSMHRFISTGFMPESRMKSNNNVLTKASGCQMQIAIIGCGAWGYGLLKKLAKWSDLNICATCDPAHNSTVNGIPVFKDISSMLVKHHLDGAIISSPNYLHLSHVRSLAPFVKHLYIEKPLCNSQKEWEELKHLVELHNLCITVGHSVSSGKTLGFLKKAILQKSIKSISMIRSVPSHRGDDDWRNLPKKCPGGVIAQLAIHLFDIAHFLLDDFTITKVEVLKQLPSGQIWEAALNGATGDTLIDMNVAFGKLNNFLIEIRFSDSSSVSWNNGIYRSSNEQQMNLLFDDGMTALFEKYYAKWFQFRHGFNDHDISVQQSYLNSLDML